MIVIMRHGETEWNRESRLLGHVDSALTEDGLDQATIVARDYLDNYGSSLPHYLYSSSLGRSVTSAEILTHWVPVEKWTKCDSLREISWGVCEGLRPFDLRYQNAMKIREQDPFGFRAEGGESIADLYERVSIFLDTYGLRDDDPSKVVIFHVHDAVSKVLRGIYLRLHHTHWLAFAHKHEHYYIINGNHCEEVQC